MKYQTLNGAWNAWNKSNPAGTHKGTIPGSVYSILLADGSMNDPYWRDNELETKMKYCYSTQCHELHCIKFCSNTFALTLLQYVRLQFLQALKNLIKFYCLLLMLFVIA